MKQFLEYIPLVFFLVVYKLDERVIALGGYEFTLGGVYSATLVLIVLTLLCYGALFFVEGSLSRMQWIVVAAVVLFGTSTVLLRSEEILKWKAPVVNWIIAAIFLGSQFIGKTNMAQSMFGHIVTMPQERWTRLNLAWVFVFLLVGTANLAVAFTFHEYWVDFKVFGSLAILIVATIAQIAYIYPYLNSDEAEAAGPKD
ncbi:MAG TPA: inner membrane-spanning protein YciB [Pseudomonadales bacterium]